jgi:hypothetical protein
MIKSTPWLFGSLILLVMFGCTKSQPPPAPAFQQRFVPISSPTPLFDGMQPAHFALDTKTGKICKTWAWNNPNSELNNVDLCYILYFRDAISKDGSSPEYNPGVTKR